MNFFGKNLALWIVIIVLLLFLINQFDSGRNQVQAESTAYSEFLKQVDSGSVQSVRMNGQEITGKYTSGQDFKTYAPDDPNLVSTLTSRGVRVEAIPPDNSISLGTILLNALPILLLIGFWFFIFRQMQGGGGKAMGFGKSKAKLLTEKHGRVLFEDVAGIDEAKQELQEVVEFLRDPQKFQRLGGKIPKGVLLVGPPGTGKTLTARAVAGEANVPFFTISGSDFVEMFVGVGASRVRDMFEQGKKNAPCIIFIDEIDAVGRHRGAGLGGGNDEREQTLNQLLVEMDGFEANEGVILIAATNRPDVLDPALLRPGRFDRQVVVPNPDILGREKILKVHLRKVPMAPDVDAKVIARGTPGFSGADLANLVNEAALLAARRNRRVVSMQELEDAKDKVMMGSERRSMVMSEEEKTLTAYHEAGHALVGIHVAGNDPLHKVTIMHAKLAMMYGGRAAEDIIFGPENVTTGASNDLQQATGLARRMVTEFGMSDKLGRLRYSDNQEEVFLGHSVAKTQNISEKTAQLIDDEVRRICEEAETRCYDVLREHQDELHTIAKALLEYETLSGADVHKLLRGESIERPEDDEPSPKSGGRASVPTTGKPLSPSASADPEPGPAE
mgnify:CR=1 FL=1